MNVKRRFDEETLSKRLCQRFQTELPVKRSFQQEFEQKRQRTRTELDTSEVKYLLAHSDVQLIVDEALEDLEQQHQKECERMEAFYEQALCNLEQHYQAIMASLGPSFPHTPWIQP